MDIRRMPKNLYLPVGAVVVLFLLPIGLGDNRIIMHILILSFIWALVASSWNLIIGYARVMSFAQMAFFTIGAYTSGLLSVQLGISPWIGMLAGGGATALVGVLIALPCLRLKGIFVALVTFALHLVITPFIMYAEPLTLGTIGFSVPTFQIGGYVFNFFEMVPYYYVGLGLLLGLGYLIYRILRSPLGLALMALRDAEPFAKSLGVSDYKHKLIVFAISSFIAGVAGAFYAHYLTFMSPGVLGLEHFLMVLIMVMLGGLGRFPGAIIGAFVITAINESLRPTGTLRYVILGTIIVVSMIYMPRGLMGIPDTVRSFIRRTSGRRRVEKEASKV